MLLLLPPTVCSMRAAELLQLATLTCDLLRRVTVDGAAAAHTLAEQGQLRCSCTVVGGGGPGVGVLGGTS